MGMTKNIFPVRPELVEGYSWFDKLTTNGTQLTRLMRLFLF